MMSHPHIVDLLLDNLSSMEGPLLLPRLYDQGHRVMDIQAMLMASFRDIGSMDPLLFEGKSLWFGVVDFQQHWFDWWTTRINDPNTRWGVSSAHMQQYCHHTLSGVMARHIETESPHVSSVVATGITLYAWTLAFGWYANEPIARLEQYLPTSIRPIFPLIGTYVRTGQHTALGQAQKDPLVQTYVTLPLLKTLSSTPTHLERFQLASRWYECIEHDPVLGRRALDADGLFTAA